MKFKSIMIAFVIAVLAGGALWYMAERPTEILPDDDRVRVMASFYVLAHFTEQVGGDAVFVQNLMPAGADPHTYEPSSREVAAAHEVDLFIYQGAGFDPAAERIAQQLPEHVRVLQMTEHFELHEHTEEEEHGHEEEHEEHEERHEHEEDPHIWVDPVLAQQMIIHIQETLSEIDPDRADQFRANADAYKAELTALDADIRAELAHCEIRTIVVSHSAFAYFADRYNIEMIAISGVSPDVEPSPQRLGEIADLAREHGVGVIFFEKLVSPRLSETIAQEIGVKTEVLDPVEGLTSEDIRSGETYISTQRKNLEHLKEALQCQTPQT